MRNEYPCKITRTSCRLFENLAFIFWTDVNCIFLCYVYAMLKSSPYFTLPNFTSYPLCVRSPLCAASPHPPLSPGKPPGRSSLTPLEPSSHVSASLSLTPGDICQHYKNKILISVNIMKTTSDICPYHTTISSSICQHHENNKWYLSISYTISSSICQHHENNEWYLSLSWKQQVIYVNIIQYRVISINIIKHILWYLSTSLKQHVTGNICQHHENDTKWYLLIS